MLWNKNICILQLKLLPILVIKQILWWMVASGKCHPAHTWALSSACSFQRAKMSLWAHTWNSRLGYDQAAVQPMEGTVSPGKEFQVKLEFQLGIAIDGGWEEGWSDLLVIAGTVLQHRVTLTRALERSWASDKHQSNLESFAALWCYQPICRKHLIYGKCHI